MPTWAISAATPIRVAWLFFVLPCLVLNYFGQGALLLSRPEALRAIRSSCSAPDWLRLPHGHAGHGGDRHRQPGDDLRRLLHARQCVQLGFLPRLTVRHTSDDRGGPDLPAADQLRAADRRADPGAGVPHLRQPGRGLRHRGHRHIHVHHVLLAIVVFRRQFNWSRPVAVGVFGLFFVLDLALLHLQRAEGPRGRLGAAGARPGADGADDDLEARAGPAAAPAGGRTACRWSPFLARLPQSRTVRVPGIGVFLTGNPDYVPGALLHNLKHNKVLHERVLFVTVQNVDVPEVPADRARRASRSWRRASTG